HLRRLRDEPLQHARRQQEQTGQLAARLGQAGPVFDRLKEIAGRHQEIEQQAETLRARRGQVAAEVERDPADPTAARPVAAALPAAHQKKLASPDAAPAALRRRHDDRARERDALTPRREALRHLKQAKEQGRWWTGAWWRATFQKDLPAQLTGLETQQQQAQA